MGKFKEISRNFRKSFGKWLFDKKSRPAGALDIGKAESILFVRYDDKLGDMITATSIFREIKQKYPRIKIKVFCGVKSAQVIKYNPNVDEVRIIYKRFYKDVFTYFKNRKHIDIAFDFDGVDPKFSHMLRWRIICPKFLIGVNKENYNIYDLSLNLLDSDIWNKHIKYRYGAFLKLLGIENPNLDYDIFIPQDMDSQYKNVMSGFKNKLKVIVNPSGDSVERCLGKEQLNELAAGILQSHDAHIFVLRVGGKDLSNFKQPEVTEIKINSILESAALIKHADIVITPDTAITHAATAFKKKTIILYRDWITNNTIWGPNNPNAVSITVDTKNGAVPNAVSNIPVNQILEKLSLIKL